VERSARAQASRMEQTQEGYLACAVERAVTGAVANADSTLRLGENVGWSIVSQEDLANYATHPEEARILAPPACERRRVEFALGRAAAHVALSQIGSDNVKPVLRGPGGEPLWGDGIAGSITHCFPWSAAVVVKRSNHFAIGVDLETMEGMQGTDISHLVCRDAELDWVRCGDFRERLTMIFSAKEAVYKAFFPFCRRYIDFKEVELTWVPEQNRFQAEFLTPLSFDLPCGRACLVHGHSHAELVFSCVIQQLQRNAHASNDGSLTHSSPDPITKRLAIPEGELLYE
jgi:4'-phosphopantetheinyl transferase EntD